MSYMREDLPPITLTAVDFERLDRLEFGRTRRQEVEPHVCRDSQPPGLSTVCSSTA